MKLLLIALALVAVTNAIPLPEVHSFDVAVAEEAPVSPVIVPEATSEAGGVIGVITPGFESFPVIPVSPVIVPEAAPEADGIIGVIVPGFETPEVPDSVNVIDGESNIVSSIIDLLNQSNGVNNVVSNNRDSTINFTYFFIGGQNTGAITGRSSDFKRLFKITSA